MDLGNKITAIKDYPVQGVTFRDLTTLFKDQEAFKEAIDELAAICEEYKPDHIVGIEARGFIVGAPVAYKLGCGFVPVRKPGKLPRETERRDYDLEYGQDSVEIHKDAFEEGDTVVIVDDLLATGGTANATADIITALGANVKSCVFLVELSNLEGRDVLSQYQVHSLVKYDD